MINFHSAKKTIVAFLLFIFLFVNAAPVKATGVEIFVLIVFAGKVYSYSSMAISAITALTSADTTKKISEESEKNIEDYIETIGERVEAADREANFAKTEEETKKAMEKAAALRSSQTQYINYLNAVRQNKAFVFKEILMEEAKGQAKGYVQGQIKSYILDDDVLDAGTSIVQGLSGSGKSAMEGKTSAAITEADRAFVESLKEGEVTGIRVAITKAEWDKFVNTIAKEEFKSYLMGESETFKNLPLSIQEKYWQKLFLLAPDEIDEIHNIMKQARETGNYFDALEEIIEKHPYYKNTFINLTKDLFGSDEEWIKKLEEELRKKSKEQEEELEELEEAAKADTETEKSSDFQAEPAPDPDKQAQNCYRDHRSYQEWKELEAEKLEALTGLKDYQNCMTNRYAPARQSYINAGKGVLSFVGINGPLCTEKALKDNPNCTNHLRSIYFNAQAIADECEEKLPSQYIINLYGTEQKVWHNVSMSLEEFVEKEENYLNNKVSPIVQELAPYCE